MYQEFKSFSGILPTLQSYQGMVTAVSKCVCVSVSTVYASEALILLTSQVKVRPYTALDKASRADDACSRFSGLINWWRKTQVEAQ